MDFFTIGVYSSTEQEFFNKLKKNRIDTFCDIRHRRAVRGSLYSFANSGRLQERLQADGIRYFYLTGLGTPDEVRALQLQSDQRQHESQRQRTALGDAFIREYTSKVLDRFDFDAFFKDLEKAEASRIVLFCVEERPEACHRWLVAQRLQEVYHYPVVHL